MDPDGSCIIAQGDGKREIPAKMRTPGLCRYQSCFSFSIDKWATGIRLSLLDLLITRVWNGPDLPDQHPGCQLRCAISSSSTALLFVPRDPGSLLFTVSLPKMLFKKGNSMRTARKKGAEALWAVFLECDLFRAGDIPSKGQRCSATSWQWKL